MLSMAHRDMVMDTEGGAQERTATDPVLTIVCKDTLARRAQRTLILKESATNAITAQLRPLHFTAQPIAALTTDARTMTFALFRTSKSYRLQGK